MRQPVYTRKYLKKQTRKHHPEQPLWSKCRQLLGCKGNWWLNLAPPRSPDFSFVTEFLFRNILHLHTNPIFFLKCFSIFVKPKYQDPFKRWLRYPGYAQRSVLPTRSAMGNWGVLLPGLGAREEGQGPPQSSSRLSAAASPRLVRRSRETLRLHGGRK